MKPTRIKGSKDPFILEALEKRPDWFREKVLARLDGYPEPEKCWTWTAYRLPGGYGVVSLPRGLSNAGNAFVHRVMWLAIRGPMPDGYVIDHDGVGCGNKSCANPDHLAAVSEWFNSVVTSQSMFGENHRKTHCPKGHPLEEGNLVPAALRRGQRDCLTCGRERSRRRRERIAASKADA